MIQFALGLLIGYLLTRLIITTYKTTRVLYENFRHMGN